jgi:phosphoenolpyruvate phosphomutase
MKNTAAELVAEQSLVKIEDRIATVKEVFRLQGAKELQEAEKRYLPEKPAPSATVLAASRGASLGELTEDKPKVVISVGGKPLLERIVETLHGVGVRDITVVRGYKKEAIDLPAVQYVDNDEFASTQEVYSLAAGLQNTEGPALVSYGDIFYHKYIPMNLLETDADFCIAVDADWAQSRNVGRYGDLVTCTHPYDKLNFSREIYLKRVHGHQLQEESAGSFHGEWMGLLKMSPAGVSFLKTFLQSRSCDELKTMRMAELFNLLIDGGKQIRVIYTRGDWIDVDEIKDVLDAASFGAMA